MKISELLRKLKANGCRFIEHRRNHDLWFSPITGKQFKPFSYNQTKGEFA